MPARSAWYALRAADAVGCATERLARAGCFPSAMGPAFGSAPLSSPVRALPVRRSYRSRLLDRRREQPRMASSLPRRLWHVTWYAAVGWPEPERRQQTTRNFTSAENAARQIDIIEAMPSHLELVSVHVSNEIEWEPVDVAALPTASPADEDGGGSVRSIDRRSINAHRAAMRALAEAATEGTQPNGQESDTRPRAGLSTLVGDGSATAGDAGTDVAGGPVR